MQRIPEVELMEDEAQARAYAKADFNEPHSMFIRLFGETFDRYAIAGHVLDLGCGPADITLRFAKSYPHCRLDGIDGSKNMLQYGYELIAQHGLHNQINLIHAYIPTATMNYQLYDAVISNSLLHHLQDPMDLWNTVKRCTKPRALIFVMDLLRPVNKDQVIQLVTENASNEPEILQRDFYNSLIAAYSTDEVKDQLDQAGLEHLLVKVVSDRHFVVSGQL